MIYKFKITSIENLEFERQVEIDAQSSFADLHEIIQKACDYSPDQLASFFIASEKAGQQTEITLLDMGFNRLQPLIMGKTPLNDRITQTGQRLLYVFDFFNDRSFYVELTQISMEKNRQKQKVKLKKGTPPVQVIEQNPHPQDGGLKNPETEESTQGYGVLDDYNEIFGEMEDLLEGD